MSRQTDLIIQEVEKVILGKRTVAEKMMMALAAKVHILLDDMPGVGKTTLALAFSRALGLSFHRIQFTPDVLPSDIVGFSFYRQEKGDFSYMPGVVTNTNLLLADEINRTSSKTQSALLEAMEEGQVTVDGQIHPLRDPFVVIATENQIGTAGTQTLPQAQLDRFLVRLHVGYPDPDHEVQMIRDRRTKNPLEDVARICDEEQMLQMQEEAMAVTIKDGILEYIARLAWASRESEWVELGISPRGSIAVSRMARACAYVRGRDYVTPEDVREIFCDVCAHRILLSQSAGMRGMTPETVLEDLLEGTPLPQMG